MKDEGKKQAACRAELAALIQRHRDVIFPCLAQTLVLLSIFSGGNKAVALQSLSELWDKEAEIVGRGMDAPQ